MADKKDDNKKGISVDEAWLRDLVNQGNVKITDTSGGRVDKQNLDQFLQEVGAGGGVSIADRKTDSHVTNLQRRAERLNAANQKRIEQEQERIAARNAAVERAAAEEKIARGENVQQKVQRGAQAVSQNIAPVADRIGAVQTVGGIGLLVAILVLLLFVVVQVNGQGDTRLKQFWYMLNGRAALQGAVTPSGYGGGASGNFGPDASGGFASGDFGTASPNPSITNGTYRPITGGGPILM